MTGLDTNVLIRFFVVDDHIQHSKADGLARSFSSQSPGYIIQVCLAEFVWVLRTYYHQPKAMIVGLLTRLVGSSQLVLENRAAIEQALQAYSTKKSDFADCLIERSGYVAGCTSTVTFDKSAAKAAGMRLL